MLSFNPAEPFPFIEGSAHSYGEAQGHSSAVDAWLGLDIDRVEESLAKNGCRGRAPHASGERQELWIGLAVKSLLTPYTEIRSLLEKLKLPDGSVVVDLGAGYGRMAFVIARHFGQLSFVGYEYVGERVKESLRCLGKANHANVKMIHADLSSRDFSPIDADVYFIYDYGTPKAIEKTLHDLRKVAQSRAITVVGRGRLCRDLIERHHPWLSQVVKPEHLGHSSIYRTEKGTRYLSV